MNTENLYREELLEHFRTPQNFGNLKSYSVSSKQLNPFCGDEIEIFILYNFEEQSRGVAMITPRRWNSFAPKIIDISFQGKGCAISIAAASMLTEFAKGKTKKQLTNFGEDDMLSMLGVEVSETRKKCALLALSVLMDCLKEIKDQKLKIKNTDKIF